MRMICVIGAGIVGMTTAYMLHQAGHKVTVISRDNQVGMGASRTNAMQLCYGTIAPFAGWGDIKKYSRYLMHSDRRSPVYMRQDYSFSLLKFYILAGLTAMPPYFKRARDQLYEMAQVSRKEVEAFIGRHPEIDFHYKQTGKIKIYDNDTSRAATERDFADLNKRYGARMQVLDSDEVYGLEPSFKARKKKIAWGTFEPDNASASSGVLCQKLHDYLSASDRYRFIGGAKIEDFEIYSGRISKLMLADCDISAHDYVMAAGAGSVHLLKQLDISIPLVPIQGYSFTLENDPFRFKSCFSDVDNKFAMNSYNGHLRISGLMDFTGFSAEIIPERVAYLRQKITENYDGLNLDGAEVRTGLRPVMAQSLPLVARHTYNNLYLNTGHGVYGWTLAFASAAKVSELI